MNVWSTRDIAEKARAGGKPVTQEYVRQLCKRGIITAAKPSRDWLVQEKDARAWLKQWLDVGAANLLIP